MDELKKLRRKYIDIIICLLAVMIIPFYFYGVRVIFLAATGLVTAGITDYLGSRFIAKKHNKGDFSWIITALVTVLLLPATAPVWIVTMGVSLAILVAKYPFGGTGHNIFNPAAVGIAFVAICWPEQVLRYPLPIGSLNALGTTALQYGISPASVLRVGGTPKIDYFDILLGKFAGPMGATCMIVLAACLLYLVFRKAVSLRVVFFALLVVGVVAVLLPRVITGRVSSLMFEGCSGALIFGLVFMSCDPTTMPDTKSGQVLYGIILGGLVVLFRRFGAVELEFVYALLIANVMAIPCDKYARFMQTKISTLFSKKKHHLDLNIEEDLLSHKAAEAELQGDSNA